LASPKETRPPTLHDDNDLPAVQPDQVSDVEKQDSASCLRAAEEACTSSEEVRSIHSFYKPHETTTHHAFPLRLLVLVVVYLELPSLLQTRWGLHVEYFIPRPAGSHDGNSLLAALRVTLRLALLSVLATTRPGKGRVGEDVQTGAHEGGDEEGEKNRSAHFEPCRTTRAVECLDEPPKGSNTI